MLVLTENGENSRIFTVTTRQEDVILSYAKYYSVGHELLWPSIEIGHRFYLWHHLGMINFLYKSQYKWSCASQLTGVPIINLRKFLCMHEEFVSRYKRWASMRVFPEIKWAWKNFVTDPHFLPLKSLCWDGRAVTRMSRCCLKFLKTSIAFIMEIHPLLVKYLLFVLVLHPDNPRLTDDMDKSLQPWFPV